MERALTRFIRALRAAGAPVSPAEAIDAARALTIVGYEDRDAMKLSLGVVLAKSEEEKATHDALFDAYFSRPDAARAAQDGARRQAQDAQQAADARARREAQARAQPPAGAGGGDEADGGEPGSGGGGGGSAADATDDAAADTDAAADAFVALAQSDDPGRIAVALERAGTAVGVDDIHIASQTPYYVRRMLETLGVEALEQRLLERLQQRSPAAQAEAAMLADARATLQRHARAYVDQRYELFGRNATEAFMSEVVAQRAIGSLTHGDTERMKVLIARMAKRLAVRHSRRRRVRNRGQLDIRRTMRANAGNDGVPVSLVWRRKRKDRPRIVAICDVSGSVAQYVRFLLLFLYSMQDTVTDLRAFAFSNRLQDVAPELRGLTFEAAMARIVDRVGSGSTDYGQAFADLKGLHWDAIDRRTTVIVLGDGRSNNGNPRIDILQEVAERAKRLIWLCPEPPSRWGTGDSCMLEYKPHCTRVTHCATALDLERAVDDVLVAYD